jgi:hypothetical protein
VEIFRDDYCGAAAEASAIITSIAESFDYFLSCYSRMTEKHADFIYSILENAKLNNFRPCYYCKYIRYIYRIAKTL